MVGLAVCAVGALVWAVCTRDSMWVWVATVAVVLAIAVFAFTPPQDQFWVRHHH